MARRIHGTLTANTVTAVTVDSCTEMITVINRSQTGEIYFTTDGATPTVRGDDTFVVLGAKTVTAPLYSGPTVVKLISSGTPDYSVVGEAH